MHRDAAAWEVRDPVSSRSGEGTNGQFATEVQIGVAELFG